MIEYLSVMFWRGTPGQVVTNYKTSRGVGWGGSMEKVVAEYGPPTAQTKASNVRIRYIYDERGIAFVFLSTSGPPYVSEIYVFRPGTGKDIWRF